MFLALTRYNPGKAGFHLNDYPPGPRTLWGLQADAELPKSLLGASSYPWVQSHIDIEICNDGLSIRKTFLQTGTAKAPKRHKKDQVAKYSKSLSKQCQAKNRKAYPTTCISTQPTIQHLKPKNPQPDFLLLK